jgi:outer membrane protein TolC
MRVFWLFLVAPPVFASPPVHLTLQQGIETALRQNPSVIGARHTVDEADGRIREVRAGYYPQFGFNGIAKVGLSGATNALGLVGLPASPFYRNIADSLNASQSVFDFSRTKHRVAYERKLRDAAEADVATVEAEVRLKVEQAYYGLLRAQRLREVTAEIVRSHQATVRQAQALYEGQIRSRVDLDLARVSLSRAQLQASDAENRVYAAVATLGLALGGAQDAEYVLESPDLSTPKLEPVESLVEEAFRARPELQASRFDREAAAEQLELARSQKKPLLNLAFSGGYARFTNVLARQLLAGGVGLALPLFTGGRIEGQEEETEAQLRLLDAREESLKQEVALEIRTAWFQLKNAIDSLPVSHLESEYARNATRLADERYRERLGSFVELAAAQASLAEASASESVGLYNAKIADAELRRAAGRR